MGTYDSIHHPTAKERPLFGDVHGGSTANIHEVNKTHKLSNCLQECPPSKITT